MKKIKIIAFSMMLLSACSKDPMENSLDATNQNGLTSNTSANKAAVTRPFNAKIYAAANTDPSIPPTSCSGDLPGFSAPDFLLNGTATHLGNINVQYSSLHHVSCDLSFATALLTTSVSGQIAGANGDLIYYTGNDVVNVASLLTATGSTGSITGTWTITGGTGKFNGATGSFTINGIVDFATNSFSCTCQGTITY